MLLENGANRNHVNNDGESALILACKHGKKKIVSLLLERGVNIKHQDKLYHIELTNLSSSIRHKVSGDIGLIRSLANFLSKISRSSLVITVKCSSLISNGAFMTGST